jgi:hypothetical protein
MRTRTMNDVVQARREAWSAGVKRRRVPGLPAVYERLLRHPWECTDGLWYCGVCHAGGFPTLRSATMHTRRRHGDLA